MTRVVAVGPNGSTLLGFLSALGTMALLDTCWPDDDVRLSWTFAAVGWRPVFEIRSETTEATIAEALFATCRGSDKRPEFQRLGDDLNVDHDVFRQTAAEAAAAATPADRRWADFMAAFGCEIPRTGSKINDTALRTMSGAGHQHFLLTMRELASLTTADDLRRALFEPWRYTDSRPTMRWDPVDDRRYALRADDPSKSRSAPIRTVRGANRLAIEALPFLSTVPTRQRVETTGFRYQGDSRNARTFRWPIWVVPSSPAVTASLLASRDLVGDPLNEERLRSIGVREVFSSTRLTVGKIRSFTPAAALMGSASSQIG